MGTPDAATETDAPDVETVIATFAALADGTALAALDVVRDYLSELKITANPDDDALMRASNIAAKAFINSPFSTDVKHCLNAVFNVAIENYIAATRQIKTHKTARAVSLREFALSIFASCFVLFNRKK